MAGCVLSDNEAIFEESGESDSELGAGSLSSLFDAEHKGEAIGEGKHDQEVRDRRPEPPQAGEERENNLQPQLRTSNRGIAVSGPRQETEVREDGQCFKYLNSLPDAGDHANTPGLSTQRATSLIQEVE